MVLVLILCLVAAFTALGSLAATGLALAPLGGLGGAALIAAPAFALVSLATGVGAVVLVLRQPTRPG
ncbi:MAG: hypothetical protein IRZ13_04080 [Acetobacteraceae bacterium]|nr:hypothetical protein [Acetobacteraceae bacterium]